MKISASFWSFLLCFLFQFQSSFGQCAPTLYFRDDDGDGIGASGDIGAIYAEYYASGNNGAPVLHTNIYLGCNPPAGWVSFNHGDLDDNNPLITDIPPYIHYFDGDRDGFGANTPTRSQSFSTSDYVSNNDDCDDSDATVKPDNVWYEDADSDGTGGSNSQEACYAPPGFVASTGDACDTNSSTLAELTWYFDADGDGFAGSSITLTACHPPPNYYATADDCNDNDHLIHPNTVWFIDNDNDHYGGDTTLIQCLTPSGYVSNTLDLDDNNPCITISTPITYYEDFDGDGYGNPSVSQICSTPPITNNYPWVVDNTDCNDQNRHINPAKVWYYDGDGDGWGGSSPTKTQCIQPPGYVDNQADYDDTTSCIINIAPQTFYFDADGDSYGDPSNARSCSSLSLVNEGITEGIYVTNGQDCNDNDPLFHDFTTLYLDQDGDGFGYNAHLLNTTNALRSTPGANGPPPGIPTTITGCVTHVNGYNYVLNTSDYDDTAPRITNLQPAFFYEDADNDTYGNPASVVLESVIPTGYVTNDQDCDDQDASLHPDTPWYLDSDGDGFGGDTVLQQCSSPGSNYVRNSDDFNDATAHITNSAPQLFFRDADGDTYGDPSLTVSYSLKPDGYVTNDLDCNDQDASLNPNTLWYPDTDGDSYGNGNAPPLQQCTQPPGYVRSSDDFDDTTPNIINTAPTNFYRDADGDTYGDPNDLLFYSLRPTGYVTNDQDCNDQDASLHPNTLWYLDFDNDSFGDPSKVVSACIQPGGYVRNKEDLDDSTSFITNLATATFYRDGDNDSFGDPNHAQVYSFAPPGFVSNAQDCNDNDPSLNPNTLWFLDQDGDGLGYNSTLRDTTNALRATPNGSPPPNGIPTTLTLCDPASLNNGYTYVRNSNDYDDTLSAINNVQPAFFYQDNDGDTYGNPSMERFVSNQPTGYVTNDQDCDDQDASLHPDTPWYLDSDGDGFGGDTVLQQCSSPGSNYVRNSDDFNDATAHITNSAPQLFFRDADGDTYGDPSLTVSYSLKPDGYVTNDLDCNDQDASLNPNTLWYPDTDGDSYGNGNAPPLQQCTQPPGYVRSSDDFDDTTPNIINTAPTNFYRDADGDTYGDPNDLLFYSLRPTGYVTNDQDCNDQDASLHPNTLWYLDFDNDSFGDPSKVVSACIQPGGYVRNKEDLDDSTSFITNLATATFYRDGDNDSFGDPNHAQVYSFAPPGFVSNAQDCNDNDPSLNPNTLWFLDQDGDGLGYNSTLRDTTNALRATPNGSPPPNGIPTTLTLCDPASLNNGYTYVRNSNDYDDTLSAINNVQPAFFYQDNDGDTYGNPSMERFVSNQPTGYVTNDQDCDDQDASLHPDTPWYLDSDGDGFGGDTVLQQCSSPGSNYVRNSDDFNDATAHITNSAPQLFFRDADGDTYGDPSLTVSYSLKPDGYVTNDLDCNDQDASINPTTVWFLDQDGDGFGYNPTLLAVTNNDRNTPAGGATPLGVPTTVTLCDPSSLNNGYSYVLNSSDFDDTTDHITNVRAQNFYQDNDGDTYGDPNMFLYYSNPPAGHVTNDQDCNDQDASLHPNTLWYLDFDNDSFGDPSKVVSACIQPGGYVRNKEDLDDSTSFITNLATATFYRDGDNDSFGDPNHAQVYSFAPPGFVSNAQDCNDNDPSLNPNTLWFLDQDGDGLGYNSTLRDTTNALRATPNGSPPPNGIPTTLTLCDPASLNNGYTYVRNSNDYDDTLSAINNVQPAFFYQDNDGDTYGNPSMERFVSNQPTGYVTNDQDCDDQDASLHPDTPWYLDSDGDGFGGDTVLQQCSSPGSNYVRNSDDFNDATAHITNSAPQLFFRDADGDTYGDPSLTVSYSLKPDGYVTNDLDCNDQDASLNPNTLWYPDTDGDSYGNGNAPPLQQCTQPPGYVRSSDDFDDTTPNIINTAPTNFYRDADGDTYGDPNDLLFYSLRPTGYVTNDQDCNDQDASLHPNTLWYLDFDNDSFGDPSKVVSACIQPGGYVRNKEDLDDSTSFITNLATATFYRDGDNDSFGDPNHAQVYSFAPPGFVSNAQDCNDNDPSLNPNTLWFLDQDGDGLGYNSTLRDTTNALRATPNGSPPPNGIPTTLTLCDPASLNNGYTYVRNSNDYDDTLSAINNVQPAFFYQDNDGDTYGNPSMERFVSNQPTGYVTNDQDCDDQDASLHPDTPWYLDSDGDGFGGDTVLQQCSSPGSNYVRNSDDFNDATAHITNSAPQLFFRDADGDTYGDPSLTVSYSLKPDGYVTNDLDCNDQDASLNPNTLWYPDTDGDSYGNGNAPPLQQCTQPPGYVRSSDDFDDTTPNIINTAPTNFYRDADGDTYGDPNDLLFYSLRPTGYVTNDQDCNDQDASLHPNTLWYLDFDNDSFGDPSKVVSACIQPGGYVRNKEDLDDSTSFITNLATATFYRDGDNDSFGDPNHAQVYSFAPPGFVSNAQDCNDNDPSLNPNTLWFLDQDGDGLGYNSTLRDTTNALRATPNGSPPPNGIPTTLTLCDPASLNNGYTYVRNSNDYDDTLSAINNVQPAFFYQDNDGDTYGNPSMERFVSNQPTGYVTNDQDCDDQDASLHPDTPWYLDSDGDGFGGDTVLQQCSSPGSNYVRNSDDFNDATAHITNSAPQLFFRDADGDTYGDPSLTVSYSLKPDGYVTNDLDCNDQDASLNPNTLWYPDTDGDSYGNGNAPPLQQCTQPPGYVRSSDDFDDTTPNIINTAPTNFYRDADGDTYGDPNDLLFYSLRPTGYVTNDQDCNDQDASLHPNTLWYLDFDNDSFGDPSKVVSACIQPGGYVRNKEDLDDSTSFITNLATATFYRDGDNDSFGDPNHAQVYSFAPPGFVSNAQDCNDNDPSLNPNTLWFLDQDGDGLGYNSTLRDTTNALRATPNGSPPPNGIPTTLTLCDPASLNNGYTYVRNSNDYDDTLSAINNVQPAFFYQDNDGDTYGNPSMERFVSNQPTGYVTNDQDCDDQDASLHPDTPWYLDSDGDGFGGDTVLQQCSSPGSNYVRNSDDFNDATAHITNSAPQLFFRDADGDTYGDPSLTVSYSLKPDGYVTNDLDCNDQDASINPTTVWFLDQDGDGFGYNPTLLAVTNNDRNTPAGGATPLGVPTTVTLCDPSSLNNGYSYVLNSSDFDDTTDHITNVRAQNFYQDNDGDTYGDPNMFLYYSNPPAGHVTNDQDCNDQDASLHPNTLWYLDFDNDSFGDPSKVVSACIQPGGYVRNKEDLDDSTSFITNLATATFYRDGDNDSFGDPNHAQVYSFAPPGFVSNAQDCNDNDPSLNPNTLWFLDQDGDGLGYNSTLRDTTNALRATPNGSPPPNGIPTTLTLCDPASLNNGYTYVRNSNDYDDTLSAINNVQPAFFYQDNDGDTYGNPSMERFVSNQPTGYVTNDQDCDDQDASLHPDTPWYLDSDGDGFGGDTVLQQCSSPGSNYVRNSDDFNDATAHITNSAPQLFFRDADGDTYGDPSLTVSYSLKPDGYVTNDLDCNDQDASLNPNTLWYPDTDGDSYGNGNAPPLQQCTQPPGYVRSSDDFDDTTPNIINTAPTNFYRDADGDTYGDPNDLLFYSLRPTGYVTNDQDCNDQDASLHPNTLWYLDFDNDSFGDPSKVVSACIQPGGYVRNKEDLDDSTSFITNLATATFYRDGDNDSFGDPNHAQVYSFAPPGFVSNAQDCNDNDPSLNPNTLWFLDQDGDGLGYNSTLRDTTNALRATPNGSPPPNGIPTTLTLCDPASLNNGYTYVRNSNDYDDTLSAINNVQPAFFYQDNDGDTYGNPSMERFVSNQPTGYVTNDQDCDDQDASLHPDTPWYLDSDGDGFGGDTVLQQCSSPGSNYVRNSDDFNDATAHITNSAPQLFFRDADGDTYGDPSLTVSYSLKPDGYVTNDLDCNDQDASLNPNTLWYPDTDGDSYGNGNAPPLQQCTQPPGYVRSSDDFDDTTPNIINTAPTNFYRDADGDTYGDPNDLLFYSLRPTGYVTNDQDCNDQDASLHPNTLWYLDFDNDSFGDPSKVVSACIQPGGYVRNKEDLDDSTSFITNLATATFYRDGDNDSFGDPNHAQVYSFAPPGFVSNAQDCNDNDPSLNPNTLWFLDQDGDGLGYNSTLRDTTNALRATPNGSPPPNGIPTTLTLCDPASLNNGYTYVRNSNDYDDTLSAINNVRPVYFSPDHDNDGYGDAEGKVFSSTAPPGYVNNAEDCEDNDPGLTPYTHWFRDQDGDGAGDPDNRLIGCLAPEGYVLDNNDLDDSDPYTSQISPTIFYYDGDSDGFGLNTQTILSSFIPPGYARLDGDCDDQDATINPNTLWYQDSDSDGLGGNHALQQCTPPQGYVLYSDDFDDNNPWITNIAPQLYFQDRDQDGYGNNDQSVRYSVAPEGYVVEGGDCNDDDPLLHPNTHWYEDQDGDGYGSDILFQACVGPSGFVTNTLDLDDSNAQITDQATRVFYFDGDGDGFGLASPTFSFSFPPPKYVTSPGDCDDENAYVHAYTLWYFDGDGDGFGVNHNTIEQCMQPEGYALLGGDCDDHDPNKIPGASCAAIDIPDPQEEYEALTNTNSRVFADRDRDGFGDPEESFSLAQIENVLVAWVNDSNDACPDKYGEILGCPEPLVLENINPLAKNFREELVFVRDSIPANMEEIQEALAQISDAQLRQVQSFPNPTEGLFNVMWEMPVNDFIAHVEVYSYPQLLLITDFPFVEQPTSLEIDLTHYPKGIYFLQFHFIDGRTLNRKIIKK